MGARTAAPMFLLAHKPRSKRDYINMALRSRTTFKKRQKEMARAEKQREKAAKRMQRKEEVRPPEPEVTLEEAAILRS
jgi:hypothetical protein